jgi:hypothetical protein
MVGAMLERVVVDEAIEVLREGPGYLRRSTGAGAVRKALDPVVGKAMHPCAQRGIGKVARVRDGWEAWLFHDFAHGLGTPEHAGLFGRLQESI